MSRNEIREAINKAACDNNSADDIHCGSEKEYAVRKLIKITEKRKEKIYIFTKDLESFLQKYGNLFNYSIVYIISENFDEKKIKEKLNEYPLFSHVIKKKCFAEKKYNLIMFSDTICFYDVENYFSTRINFNTTNEILLLSFLSSLFDYERTKGIPGP